MLSQQNARLGLHHPLLGWLLMFTLVFSLNCQGMGTTSQSTVRTDDNSDHGCCFPTSQPSQSVPGDSSCCISPHHLPFDKAVGVVMVVTAILVAESPITGQFVTAIADRNSLDFEPPPTLALRI